MSLIVNLIFSATSSKTLKRFRNKCCKPSEIQERLLNHIIEKNAGTAFGKKYLFGNIKSFGEYQKMVPISNYDELSPYINAELNGKAAQLTLEKPVFFAMTSGTTGSSKYIPVTNESLTAKSKLVRIWLSAFYKEHPGIFSGRILTVVSPEVESLAPSGVPCGAESGHGYRNIPRTLKSLYSCPYEIYELKSYDAKYYCLLRIAASQRISLIFSCNPSTILLLAKSLGQHTEDIIRDIHDGTVSDKFDIPNSLRSSIGVLLQANSNRATFLEEAATNGAGQLLPKYVWPEMVGITCWKGGTVGMYLDKFDQYFNKDLPIREIGYLASEHRGSIPISDKGSAGVLAIPTNVYEFYPADENHQPQGSELLTVDQLEEGKKYYIYVTTLAGLYRYDMNDIIEVLGFYENTPLISFVQKGKGVVSFTGEKLYESQVLSSVNQAFISRQGKYEFIAAVGEMHDDKPRYVFLTEFDDTLPNSEAHEMLRDLEITLQRHNQEYASKRASHRIETPILRIIRNGEFDLYRRRMVEKGRLDGQFKILRLTTDTSFAKEFEVERDVVLKTTSES